MTKTRDTAPSHPDLSALTDKSAEDWSAPEIQSAARSALKLHAPDREPLTWIKRFGILPWLHRNHAVCRHCGGTYPCITHRYATQLLSAGRYTMAKPQHETQPGTQPEPNPN